MWVRAPVTKLGKNVESLCLVLDIGLSPSVGELSGCGSPRPCSPPACELRSEPDPKQSSACRLGNARPGRYARLRFRASTLTVAAGMDVQTRMVKVPKERSKAYRAQQKGVKAIRARPPNFLKASVAVVTCLLALYLPDDCSREPSLGIEVDQNDYDGLAGGAPSTWPARSGSSARSDI